MADSNIEQEANQFIAEIRLDRSISIRQKSTPSAGSLLAAANQSLSGEACFLDAIGDGDFELNDGSWTFTGTAFDPLCSPTACGPDIATNGEFYLWLGGGFLSNGNGGTATQTVVIPTDASTLTFDYIVASSAPDGGCESPSDDLLEVLIDGEQVFRSADPCVSILTFQLAQVDLAALGLNDGLAHEIQFRGFNVDNPENPSQFLTNAFVDNVHLFSPAPLDSDGDGILNAVDNCTEVINPDQRDTNGDGLGNVCDPDLDNDGIVNFVDVAAWTPFFNTSDSDDADFDGDGFVNFRDLDILMQLFLQEPGPNFQCSF
ncbi:MAG: thrombospondin type 3 repeat-containing protein [Gammaproteobacteria bacterium]